MRKILRHAVNTGKCSRFIVLCLLCAVIPSAAVAGRIYGVESLARFDQLPCLLEGTQVRQVSSCDRSGGNDDGFNGTYSALYVDKSGEYVLFDEIGSGCLYRFWMTYGSSPVGYSSYRLRFYFDNESAPRLDLSIADFFDGMGAPLEFPMVGPFDKSSHGCYCYVPFAYRERLKITLSGPPSFYSMTYHRFDSAGNIVSWTGNEDRSLVMAQWNAVGTDPKPTNSNVRVSGSLSIAAGATGTLFRVEGAGVVQSIKLDPSPSSTNILSNVWIQMAWDDSGVTVDVPLGDFFGSGKNEIDVTSLPIGMKISGSWYCYFPMPFWESAEIRIVNKGSEQVTTMPFEVHYATNTYDRAKSGYFNARFHEEAFVGNGTDFNFINEKGRGHVVGVSLFMESFGAGGYMGMNYLEGDERAYVDGALSPSIHGTGTEDYFNAGWYFNQGVFSRPYHGHPWRDQFHANSTNYTQAYRFHMSDVIPFNSSVKFGMEHGDGNTSPGIFSSVTYFYKTDDPALAIVPVVDLDIADRWAEELYDYQPPPAGSVISNGWLYGGDDDAVIQDVGLSYSGATAGFTVPLVENIGLLLRRRTDQGVGGQAAQVFIDGILAGVWYEADHNMAAVNLRWLDSEFMVPASFFAGKTEVRITIEPLALSSTWNEYRYWAYCIRPFGRAEDTDLDQLPDDWERQYTVTLGTLHGDIDSDDDGFTDLAEYISGTGPLDFGSFPSIYCSTSGPGVRFQTARGRLYHLQKCSSLVSNDWKTVRANIPGTGTQINIPNEPVDSSAFYRFTVQKP